MEEVYDEKTQWMIQKEFTWLQDKCYLDYAGSGVYSSQQLQNATKDLLNNIYGNPHSGGFASKLCSDAIDQIRHKVLDFFHTNSKEYSVIFTSGATSAIKLLLETFSWNNSPTRRGVYAYTCSNHTSIVGGRVIANDAGAATHCLPDTVVETLLDKENGSVQTCTFKSNSLFAYPAQCNFSGRKFPLKFVSSVQKGALSEACNVTNTKWYCLLDAATFCTTSDLNLSVVKPDFVCVSFYKIFGYPTGVGALLVRNDSALVLQKKYFGGGTVDASVPSGVFVKLREGLHERFEDGTLPFLSIIALTHGFDTFARLGLSTHKISLHVFRLAKYAFERLKCLHHWNDSSLVEIYSYEEFTRIENQGGIITFNLKRADGSYIGYVEVLHMANLNSIQLRTGCFCNVGACQKYLNLSDEDLLSHYQTGHICGDENDLVNGRPTGAVRVSFGYPSTVADVHKLIQMIKTTFLETEETLINNTSRNKLMEPKLQSICLYPIKSCGAMKVSKWRLTSRGLEFDRQWMVVTESGLALTQKREPLLCKIMPTVDADTGALTVTFSGEDPITIEFDSTNEEDTFSLCKSKVCGDQVEGYDCGVEIAEWLMKHLKTDGLRLIRQGVSDSRTSKVQDRRGRSVEALSPGQLSLANQAQYLLVNNDSVRWLKSIIKNEPELQNDTFIDRFRANLIVTDAKALEESQWTSLRVGNITFKVEGPCTRCQMICIDQQTGEKNRKPLVELSRALKGQLRFGIYCSHQELMDDSILSVGDLVTVVK